MTVTLAPVRDQVLVTLEPEPEASQIVATVKAASDRLRWAVVRAVGPEVRDVRVGRRVLLSILAGVEVAGGFLVPEASIVAYAEAP